MKPTFTFDISSLKTSAKKLTRTVDASLAKAARKAAKQERPAFLAFDETEAFAVPSKKGIAFSISGPQVDGDVITSSAIEEALKEQAENAVAEIMADLQKDIEGVFK